MILTVHHATTYRYAEPARGAVQSLRLFPSKFDGQTVLDWKVSVSTPQGLAIKGGAHRDGAGDKVEGWSARGPLTELTILVEGRVETRDLAGVLRGHRESVPPEVYLRDTGALTAADLALTEAAEAAVAGAPTPLDRAHSLARAVAEAIAYKPGVTHAHTSAAEAFAQGEGVCQDHAHALIAMARAVGLPARYVSGYLFTDAEGEAHEAAHAWAEIYVNSGLGWVGFDAANRCCPDARYIRLGSGYDARDAAPVRGVALGTAEEVLDVTVALTQVQQ